MIDIASLPKPSPEEAARFLGHATLGYTRAEVDDLVARGYSAWFTTQFGIPATRHASHFDWLKSKFPYDKAPVGEEFLFTRLTNSSLRRFVEGSDTLRQKMTFSLSQILVTSIFVGIDINWRQYAGAGYLDLLTANALGTYRNLVGEVTKSPLMAMYLTFLGSQKGTATRSPDENYARELLQLFTIGVDTLNLTTGSSYGAPTGVEPYPKSSIAQLARVFTGFYFNGYYSYSGAAGSTYESERYNYRNQSSAQPGLSVSTTTHDTNAITLAISPNVPPLSLPAVSSPTPAGIQNRVSMALDHIMAHPNVAPFISSQLIQRFVTSNPSPDYLRRVAQVFTNTGGNLTEVVKAVLMDESLFDASKRRVGGLADDTFGKVREPFTRLVQWARATGATSTKGNWDTGWYEGGINYPSKLGQAPLMASSVFNFYRPGYVAPGSQIAKRLTPDGKRPLVAPELQITDEVTTVAYINFMAEAIDSDRGVSGMGDVRSTYAALTPLAGNPTALVAELNLLLAAGRLNSVNKTRIAQAVSSLPQATALDLRKRVQSAVLMVMAAPEYIVQK
jgi:uncharacterized protein (DUF1800 family)